MRGMDKELVRLSKFLRLVPRHKPERSGCLSSGAAGHMGMNYDFGRSRSAR
jgi:hypothetical protein